MVKIYISRNFVMKDRIKAIMDNEGMTPTKFADRLKVNRAVISHILNGRNNPSLDVVTSILSELPYVNSDWLLNGKGNMYNDGVDRENLPISGFLFNKDQENIDSTKDLIEKSQGNRVNDYSNTENSINNKNVIQEKMIAKKISQIIIYYEDNTFETFVINK